MIKLKSSKSSRAEVMLQHLDAPLPLEELDDMPHPVSPGSTRGDQPLSKFQTRNVSSAEVAQGLGYIFALECRGFVSR